MKLKNKKASAGLSEERAKAAKAYLSGKGVAEARMSLKGMASDDLNNADGTTTGQAKNRRVQFKVIE